MGPCADTYVNIGQWPFQVWKDPNRVLEAAGLGQRDARSGEPREALARPRQLAHSVRKEREL